MILRMATSYANSVKYSPSSAVRSYLKDTVQKGLLVLQATKQTAEAQALSEILASWVLKHPRRADKKITLIAELMEKERMDIIILIETRQAVDISAVIQGYQHQIKANGDLNDGIGYISRIPLKEVQFINEKIIRIKTEGGQTFLGCYALHELDQKKRRQDFIGNS